MRGARTASQLLHARHSSRLPGILAALRTKEQNEANSLLHGEGAAASLSFSAPRGAVYLSTSTISVGVSIAFCVLVLPSPRVYYSFCPISRSSRDFLSSPRPLPPPPLPASSRPLAPGNRGNRANASLGCKTRVGRREKWGHAKTREIPELDLTSNRF